MVSKLSFKGEKKNKRKTHSSKHGNKSKKQKSENDSSVGTEVTFDGWTTATNKSDIEGPLLLTFLTSPRNIDKSNTRVKLEDEDDISDMNNKLLLNESSVASIAIDPTGKAHILKSKHIDFIPSDHSTNFPPAGQDSTIYNLPMHCTEPTSVQQVFVVIPLTSILASTKQSIISNENKKSSEKDIQIALLTTFGKYLSYSKSIGKFDGTAEAIGPKEMFTLIPDNENENELGTTWKIESTGEFFKIEDPGESTQLNAITTPDKSEGTPFIIRIQTKHKSEAKRLILLQQEVDSNNKETLTKAELEKQAKIPLTDKQVRILQKAHKEGDFHEKLLNIKLQTKTDTMC